MFGPRLGVKSYCKVCDIYVEYQDLESHLATHIKERNSIQRKRKKEAQARKVEAARLARLAKLEK